MDRIDGGPGSGLLHCRLAPDQARQTAQMKGYVDEEIRFSEAMSIDPRRATMTRKILKYGLKVRTREKQIVEMPAGAVILHIDHQEMKYLRGDDAISMWALCGQTRMVKKRAFQVVVTGREYDGLGVDNYVGTVNIERGAEIYHVFEVRP